MADEVAPDEAYARLNESFYATKPSSYFEHRLNNLLVAAADHEFGAGLRGAGIEILGDTISVDDEERIKSDLSPDDLGRFITAESVVLFSHTAESCLRQYLGHALDDGSPWFEISSLSFEAFWNEVDKRFTGPTVRDSKLREEVGHVFLGGSQRHAGFPSDGDWDSAIDRLTAWMSHLARELNELRDVHNAAKHGFATRPDQAFIAITTDDGRPVISHEGPSLEVLVHSKYETKVRSWSLKTHWVHPLILWVGVGVACHLMDGIWTLGRARHLGQPDGLLDLYVPPNTPDEYQRAAGVRGMRTWSMGLLTETKRPR